MAIKEYEAALPGCITFTEISELNGNCVGYPSTSSVYVKSSSGGCFVNGLIGEWPRSQRSRWGRHSINLAPNGCDTVGVAVHELGHVLGMSHEQKRRDRDNSIRMNWSNIQASWKSQFTVGDGYTKGKYDYASIMHYPMYSGQVAINARLPLMTPINCGSNCPTALGQRVGLSKLDHVQMQEMYSCPASKTAGWTDSQTCMDSPSQKDCASYVRNGNCRRDARPCCACRSWNSGWKVRRYNPPTTVTPTKKREDKVKPTIVKPTKRTCSKGNDRLAQNIC